MPQAWRPTFPAAKVLHVPVAVGCIAAALWHCQVAGARIMLPRDACSREHLFFRRQTPSLPLVDQAGEWSVGVLPGPNAAPDYFTPEDIEELYSSSYSVHYNS